jgi:hypothetical protein
MLNARAREFRLHQHPRLIGRVNPDELGPVLLAVLQAAWNENRKTEDPSFKASKERVRLVMGPILSQMAEQARLAGLDDKAQGECARSLFVPKNPPFSLRLRASVGLSTLGSSSSTSTKALVLKPAMAALPPIFSPPSAGPQALQKLVSWLTPPTISAVFTHKAVDPMVNYDAVLSEWPPVNGGRRFATSFLYVTFTNLVSVWYDLTLTEGQRFVSRQPNLGT